MRDGWAEILIAKVPEKIAVNPVTGCWDWLGAKDPGGYGVWWDGERIISSHVLIYQLYRGAVPEGLQLVRVCRNRGCGNPWHQEAVSRPLRGLAALNALKVCCKRGHPLEGDNLWVNGRGSRVCRTCERIRQASPAFRAQHAAAKRRRRAARRAAA